MGATVRRVDAKLPPTRNPASPRLDIADRVTATEFLRILVGRHETANGEDPKRDDDHERREGPVVRNRIQQNINCWSGVSVDSQLSGCWMGLVASPLPESSRSN